MKLLRVVANRFGALRDVSLDDIGPGLTIVLGPNESGKSTFATLVRQVLYGYPMARQKGAEYKPAGKDGRQGRLFFGNDKGEWTVTRLEGTKGGTLEVQTLEGEPRGPELLQSITGTVSAETYNVVFGFSLAEMAEIELGKNEDVLAQLYAGSSGAGVNPMDAHEALEAQAGALFKERSNANSQIGATLAELTAQRRTVADLEREAAAYASERIRLGQLAERLEPLRARQSQADLRLRELERDAQQAQTLTQQIAEARERSDQLERTRQAQSADAAALQVNEALLAVAPELLTVLDEAAAMRQRRIQADQQKDRAAELRRKAEGLAVPDGVVDDAEARGRVETRRDKNARLEAEVEATAREADKAAARADAYRAQADAEARGKRPGSGRWVAVGVSLVVLGVAGAAAGVFLEQIVAVVMAGVMALAGVVVLVLGVRTGAQGPGLAIDAQRLEADAIAAQAEASAAALRLKEAADAWEAWLSGRGLAARGTDPAAVMALLDDARTNAQLIDQAHSAEQEAARHLVQAAEWNRRLFALVHGPLGLVGVAEDHDGVALAARIREMLETTRAAADTRDRATEAAAAAERECADVALRLGRLSGELVQIAQRHEAPEDCRLHIDAMIAAAQEDLATASLAYEELKAEHYKLSGQLDSQGRDDSMARARQRIEGLTQKAREDADSYLVERLALELVDQARANYERNTQPKVVKVASEVFSAMTEGRYERVQVPLFEKKITAVTRSGEVLLTQALSRGTQEALYLSLRVGLIEAFGEQGPHLPVLMDDVVVNFDPERVNGAAEAIARLVKSRQVIYFTCHESTAAALAARVPGAATIRLGRCEV